jgi:hypothetical protein
MCPRHPDEDIPQSLYEEMENLRMERRATDGNTLSGDAAMLRALARRRGFCGNDRTVRDQEMRQLAGFTGMLRISCCSRGFHGATGGSGVRIARFAPTEINSMKSRHNVLGGATSIRRRAVYGGPPAGGVGE